MRKLKITILIVLVLMTLDSCRSKDDKPDRDLGKAVFTVKQIVFNTDTIFIKRRTYVGISDINVVALSLDRDEDIEPESDYILSNSGVFYNPDSDSLKICYTGTILTPKHWTSRIGVGFVKINDSTYSNMYDNEHDEWKEFK
jgi:hypothetical protein